MLLNFLYSDKLGISSSLMPPNFVAKVSSRCLPFWTSGWAYVYILYLSAPPGVSLTCKSAWLKLYQLGKIREYLTTEQTKSAVHAYVTSKIDQNNSLLFGIPDNQIKRIQKVQNAAAKLICKKRKYDHVTPLLENLHWLPVKERITFKVLLLTFKSLRGEAPSYLSDLVKLHSSTHSLRSLLDPLTLNIPRSYFPTLGDRAFSVGAPRLWNTLPLEIRESTTTASFKRQLKTYLFRNVYE